MSNYYDANRNAKIASRIDRTGKVRTETVSRDADSVTMAASFDQRNNRTNVFIDVPTDSGVQTIKLDGRRARTLYRLLNKHYNETGRTFSR